MTKKNISIKPYDFIKLKDGNFVFVRNLRQRRVEHNMYLNDLIVDGILIDKSLCTTTEKTNSSLLNLKTSKFQTIIKFLDKVHTIDNFWCDIEDIKSHISRKETVFNIAIDED